MTNLATTANGKLLTVNPNQAASITEKVIAENGDLYQLTAVERKIYYLGMCDRYGLDPFSSPFDYLSQRINAGTKDRPNYRDRVTLYPNQRASNAFAQQHQISTEITSKEFDGKFWIVTVVAKSPNGRSLDDVGSCEVTNWVDKAVALKKAISQARRRAILALVGFSAPDDETRAMAAEAYDPPMDVMAGLANDDGVLDAIIDPYPPTNDTPAHFDADAARNDCIQDIDRYLATLNWTTAQAKEFLKSNFGVTSRQKLNLEQLVEFADKLLHLVNQQQLRSQPSPEPEPEPIPD